MAVLIASLFLDTSCDIHERTMTRGSPRDSRSDEKKKYDIFVGGEAGTDVDDGGGGGKSVPEDDAVGAAVFLKRWTMLAQRMDFP